MTDNQIFTALGISVVAGFLVIVFGFIAKLLWEYFFVNFYLKITAKHLPDIEGDWEAEYEVSEGQWQAKDETKIKQYGYKIRGSSKVTYLKKDCDEVVISKFEINGILRNDILSGYYVNTDRKKKGSGSFSFNLSNGGERLVGGGMFYDVDSGKVCPAEYELVRKG